MRLIDADTLIQEIKRWKEREIADGLIGKGIKAMRKQIPMNCKEVFRNSKGEPVSKMCRCGLLAYLDDKYCHGCGQRLR